MQVCQRKTLNGREPDESMSGCLAVQFPGPQNLKINLTFGGHLGIGTTF